jgi:hypothetical protein
MKLLEIAVKDLSNLVKNVILNSNLFENKYYFLNKLSKVFSQIEQQNNNIDATYEQKMDYLHTLEEKIIEKFELEAKVKYSNIGKKGNGKKGHTYDRRKIYLPSK